MIIKSRQMRWAWHVACVVQMINACRIMIRNPERHGRLGCSLEDSIKIDLKEKVVGWVWNRFIWLRVRTGGRLLSVL
jgi:hypothetical protein